MTEKSRSRLLLGHGSGGRMSRDLIQNVFVNAFSNPQLEPLADSAVVDAIDKRIAFTTDAYIVSPPFFAGADIGSLAVSGTVNDLAVVGARPAYLSYAVIAEEGFDMADLERIVASTARTAETAGVRIVTGDTKVVERGAADGVFLVTAGLGFVPAGREPGLGRIEPGDRVVVTGTIGEHAIAVLQAREQVSFVAEVESDCAPIAGLLERAWDAAGDSIHFLRDPTRGGLATVLNEIVDATGGAVHLNEKDIPVLDPVAGVCELLGYDPLYLANEGKAVIVVAPDAADDMLAALRDHPLGRATSVIGEVRPDPAGRVVLHTRAGGSRIVTMLAADQLPRIC